jgi:hypothetical protein
VSTSAASSRPDRRIALLKPDAATDDRVSHALQLLDSIVWAFQGTTHATWTIAAPDVADVVVVHESDRDERIARWKAQGKPVVEISTAGRADATGSGVLVYPFRAAQVLALLEKLDAQLTAGADPGPVAPQNAASPPENTDPWSFVEALRTLRSVQNSEAWLVGRSARTPVLWLRGDAVAYTADTTTVQAIRRGALHLGNLTLQKATEPAGGPALRSGMELSWFAGYYAGPTLAPMLNAGVRYRISRWPNFGLIRPLPSQMRIAAALAAAAGDLSEVAAQAGVSAEEATRTLNALHSCGVLVPFQSERTTSVAGQRTVAEPRGGFVKFLRDIRKHLGLGAGES